jgi:hypothetical protein
MKLYAYCLSDEPAGASVEGLTGVGGAAVRVLEVGGAAPVVAVVSGFEGERAAVTRENLLAHNRVNAHFLARATPLPFRFGTLADDARLRAYVEANEGALAEAFARVRGCVEMGVKVRLGGGALAAPQESAADAVGAGAAREVSAPQRAGAARETGAAGSGRGTAFLLAKRREILGEEALKARAEGAAARLAACVGGLAREAAVRLSPEGPIVVRASHLVGRGDVSEYRARVRELGAGFEGLHLLTSGPWPPYSFGVSRDAGA